MFGKKISLDDYCLAAALKNCEPFRLAMSRLDKTKQTARRWEEYYVQYVNALAAQVGTEA